MGKIITTLLIACVHISCCVALSSCNTRPALKNLEDVAETLEDKDHAVKYVNGGDDLKVGVKEYLVAVDNNGNHLRITVYADAKMAKLAYKELKDEYDKDFNSLTRRIEQIEHTLKKYEDDLDSDEIDKYEDELKELEEELEKTKEKATFGISGKTVLSGTVNAAKDSKG